PRVTPNAARPARPAAGPVVPLTVTPGNTDESLLGGAGNSSPHGDAIATRVLVKGEPLPARAGRADDFMLQRSNDEPVPPAAAAPASGALASAPPEPLRIESTPETKPAVVRTNSKPTQG